MDDKKESGVERCGPCPYNGGWVNGWTKAKRYKAERDMYLRERDRAMDLQREAEERADALQQQLSEARAESDRQHCVIMDLEAQVSRLREGLRKIKRAVWEIPPRHIGEMVDELLTTPPDTQEHDPECGYCGDPACTFYKPICSEAVAEHEAAIRNGMPPSGRHG